MADSRLIQILVDNPSWILTYAKKLCEDVKNLGYTVRLVKDKSELQTGYITFLIGCIYVVPKDFLALSEINLVVHESALPNRRGYAPLFWSILNNENDITFSLVEALDEVDSGPIFSQRILQLNGTELHQEIRDLQGQITVDLCYQFAKSPATHIPQKQIGEASYCRRRNPEDSELNPEKTIAEQFNLLRIVNNEIYPAFFEYRGVKYKIKIENFDD